jgi:hypothetical protein
MLLAGGQHNQTRALWRRPKTKQRSKLVLPLEFEIEEFPFSMDQAPVAHETFCLLN